MTMRRLPWKALGLGLTLVTIGAHAQPARPAKAPVGAASAPAPTGARAPLATSLTGGAREAYEAGRLLFANRDMAGALVKFRQSFELSGDTRLLWNMAICEKELRHYLRMRVLLDRYLRETPGLTADERAQTQETLATIANLVGQLRLTVSEPGASVTIDGEPAGTTPLAVVPIDIGRHVVKVEKSGFAAAQQTIEITGGTEQTVSLRLEPASREGTLMVHAPEDASITVDGVPRGRGLWSGTVAAGPHTVRVTASGRREHLTTVEVSPQGTRSLEVTLEREATRWPWVVGASVVVVGLVVGGYFVLRPDPETRLPTRGTLDPGQVRLPLTPMAGFRL